METKENESPVIYEFKPVDESEVDDYDGRVCFSTFIFFFNSCHFACGYITNYFQVLEMGKYFNQFILTCVLISHKHLGNGLSKPCMV